MKVPFVDLRNEYEFIREDLEKAIVRVFKKGNFILGDEVKAFEDEWARYLEVKYAITVANGTDALFIALKALGIGPGDEVIIPSFTFIATALSVTHAGAKPVLVDCLPGFYSIDPDQILQKITPKTKAIIPVHLYGSSCDMKRIIDIAKINKLYVIEDAAQAHGGKYQNKKLGTIGDIGCFSFYPTKNLGAYGDGGALVTNNVTFAKRIMMLRNYGQIKKYVSTVDGYNSRLDEIQASILRVKLKHLDSWTHKRYHLANIYDKEISTDTSHLKVIKNTRPAYHLYPIFTKKRKSLMKYLESKNISTLIHYPVPIHMQDVYRSLLYREGEFPISEKAARQEISLPMHPFLKDFQVVYIANLINSFINK